MKKYRITVLTSQLLRLEYDEEGIFEDRKTQTVCSREFPSVEYEIIEDEERLQILTKHLHLIYNKKEFTANGLSIRLRDKIYKMGSTWHFGEDFESLGGTVRTLDQVDGETELGKGLLSQKGYTWMDDSHSLIVEESGEIVPRERNVIDGYFWGYGRDYKQCLKDFYTLCGPQPLLPKYVFGNWWSRYYKYTQDEYLELISRFEAEDIPFTVAVLDMDWHIVDVDSRYGSGWTGYTWNRDLIPEPEQFLGELHKKGLKTTLNVHPADGVMPYEDAYEDMCHALGKNQGDGGILFDITDADFREAYFKYLHHPNEKAGVDFWWIDWQQGNITDVKGLDPLWLLNYYHYKDNGRDGKRPLILSRYAGIGSHRYPLGFSGDTIVSWESLKFQPYFTACASNVGYGWWSHDIGGHMNGYKDDELAVRWVQYGVFSPINRLHSSDNPFDGKEPWRYGKESHEIMNTFLKLRHRLIPYIYSMSLTGIKEGIPLIRPMYYEEPWKDQAYEIKEEYYFGSELLAAPVTSPADKTMNLAEVKVWLPDGIWTDIFTGQIYRGGRFIKVYRKLDTIPVFARAGAILPMYTEEIGNKLENPEIMELHIYGGADGCFHLCEDDEKGNAEGDGWADTEIKLDHEKRKVKILPVKGDTHTIPQKRTYHIFLHENEETIETVLQNIDVLQGTEWQYPEIKKQEKEARYIHKVFDFLNEAQINFKMKKKIYECVQNGRIVSQILCELFSYELPQTVYGALCEILTAFE